MKTSGSRMPSPAIRTTHLSKQFGAVRAFAGDALSSPTNRYPQVMSELAMGAKPAGIIAKTSRRVAVVLTMSIGVGLMMMSVWRGSPSSLFLRTIILGLSATTAFGLFEVWPRSLPQWLQRWALQVVAVGVLMPVTTLLLYLLLTPQSAPPFWRDPTRMNGWTHLTVAAILLAPWTALAAIVRQKEAFVRDQKLAFSLERSELRYHSVPTRSRFWRLEARQVGVFTYQLVNALGQVSDRGGGAPVRLHLVRVFLLGRKQLGQARQPVRDFGIAQGGQGRRICQWGVRFHTLSLAHKR